MDVFPAHASFAPAGMFEHMQQVRSHPPMEGTRYLDRVRVIVTETEVAVAQDGDSGPVVMFREKIREWHRSTMGMNDSYVTTVSGVMIAFSKNDACGCGSRLRAWNPYKSLLSTRPPTE
jgi:hypothetical protein